MTIATTKTADVSDCGRYRNTLTRDWASDLFDDRGRVLWIMLNPSTADGIDDDQTITRCINYSHEWGYSGLTVVNLFAYRATKPIDMKHARDRGEDIVGPDNDDVIVRTALEGHPLVVAAWGAQGGYLDRDAAVRQLLADGGVQLHHIGLTGGGRPRHPSRRPNGLTPTLWPPEAP